MRNLVIAAAAAAALSACAQQPETPRSKHFFPEAAARHLFADGYRHLNERYIDAVSLDRTTMAGLTELRAIAPELHLRHAEGGLQLAIGQQPVGRFATPPGNDSEAWAELTAAVVRASWDASPMLRQARPDEIYNSMFWGMLHDLDSYSRYTDPRTAEQARASREGFGGIGVALRTVEGRSTIVDVIPRTPAERAGLLEQDVITHVDGEPIEGLPHGDVIERLRGPTESTVRLTVQRGGQSLAVDVTRSHIVPQTVTYRREDDVVIIRLSSFNRQTTTDLSRLVARARAEVGEALKGIVLDLRSNPGGLLDQAVAVADLFLDDGLIVATRGRHPASNSTFSATEDDIARGVRMVVLINGKSASAAEMVAAALQDWGRAAVIGTTTHGKGSVQNVARMPNGGELIITWSRMHAPSGYVLDRLGVLPGICTSSVVNGHPLERRRGGRIDVVADFDAWHRYETADERAAKQLRRACPPEDGEPAIDLELAKQVLHSATLYAQALRPWVGTVTASRP